MVFQDPLTSLNPLYRIGDQIVETIRTHANVSMAAASERAIDLLQEVGIQGARSAHQRLPARVFRRHAPARGVGACLVRGSRSVDRRRADHRARCLDPGADHRLLKRLCRERGTAVMLITHDMGVIAETADRVAVMYAGRIAEIGPVRDVVQAPATPTRRG
jgi:peptide/nickel transport system ATP-binding protein